jgi:hypothetical protein
MGEEAMDGITSVRGGSDVEAALREIATVKETAGRMANGQTAGEADQIRVLAGLIQQLAEQTERLWTPMQPPIGDDTTYPEELGEGP